MAQKDMGDIKSSGFNDGGDLDFIENLSARGLFVGILEDLLLREACFSAYDSLNEVGRKVFVLMVNDNLNAAEIAERLGITAGYVCMIRKAVRKKADVYFREVAV
jgi:DNA-directed RNA polymerase specialized sigma subunit